jgi:hypothetical protein
VKEEKVLNIVSWKMGWKKTWCGFFVGSILVTLDQSILKMGWKKN